MISLENKKITIILIAIFLLALAARSNILQYNGLFEYDAYFHARMTADLIQQGYVNNPDTLAYYQVGGAPQTFTSMFWIISVGIYQLLFGWNIGFDFNIFTKFIQFLPVVCGAIISILFFFVGRTAFKNDSIGLIMAFVASITPAFVYRTMAGAQGDNAFGFLPFMLGIYFLICAINEKGLTKKNLVYTVLSGAFFMLMVFAWNMYLIAPIILLFYLLYAIWFLRDDMSILKLIIILFLIGIASILHGDNILNMIAAFSGVSGDVISITILLSSLIGLFFRFKMSDFLNTHKKTLILILFICMIIGLIISLNIKSDFVDRTTLGSLVGEESIGHNFFEGKYNIFIFLPWLAFFLTPFIANKNKYIGLFFMILLLLFFMAWYKLKFTFALGFAIAFGAGIILYAAKLLYDKYYKTNKSEFKIIVPVLFFFLLCGVAASGVFILDYVPPVDADISLAQTIDFLKTTPENSKIFNQWGLGHILSYEARRAVSADNRNYSALANRQFAEFENTTDVSIGYKIARQDVNADYILIDIDDFYSLRTNEFYIADKVDASLGVDFTKPIIQILSCSTDGSAYNCNGNIINSNSFDAIRQRTWHSTPDDFYNGQYPIYTYVYQNSIVYLNDAANNTNLAKILFRSSDTTQLYDVAYANAKYILLKTR